MSNMIEAFSRTQKVMPKMYRGKKCGVYRKYLVCFLLSFAISISGCCNSTNKNKIPSNKQSRTFLRSSDNCDVDLPYSSYQKLESLCKLCARYIRDYPELYGQCR